MIRFKVTRGYSFVVFTVTGILWGLVALTSFLLAPQHLLGSALPEPYTDARLMLHTLVEIKAYGDNVEDAVSSAFNEI